MIITNTLRNQLLTGVFLACVTILVTQTLIRYFFILPDFERMAIHGDRLDVERVASQVKQELKSLSNLVYDSAVWDAMYDAATTSDSDWFIENYIIKEGFERINVNGWYLYNQHGSLVAGGSIDDEGFDSKPPLFEETQTLLSNGTIFRLEELPDLAATHKNKVLFIEVLGQPAIVISHAVFRSDESGRLGGTLLLWRNINDAFVETLTPGIDNDIELHKPIDHNKEALSMMYGIDTDATARLYDGRLYIGFPDPNNNPLFALSIKPRERQYDGSLFDATLAAGLVITLSVIVLFYYFVDHQIIKPISSILYTVSNAMRSKNFTVKAKFEGRNEIYRLGKKLNQMFALISQQRNELLLHNKQLERISNTDPLTGLANRRHLDNYLRGFTTVSEENKAPLSLLMIDVDFFKKYNDHYGHSQGDKALIHIGRVLNLSTRAKTDLVARFGGEEFVVVLPFTAVNDAHTVANNILDAVRKARLPHDNRPDLDIVTISIGISCWESNTPLDPSRLIDVADQALYKAKEKGRNGYCFLPVTGDSAPPAASAIAQLKSPLKSNTGQ